MLHVNWCFCYKVCFIYNLSETFVSLVFAFMTNLSMSLYSIEEAAWRGEGTCPWTRSVWEAEAEYQCPAIFPVHQSRLSLPSHVSWYFCISSLRGCGRPVPAAEPMWNPHPRHNWGLTRVWLDGEKRPLWTRCSPIATATWGPPRTVPVISGELHFLKTFFQRRKWQPTPLFLPGKSHGWRTLAGCSPWGLKESDTTERLNSNNMEREAC